MFPLFLVISCFQVLDLSLVPSELILNMIRERNLVSVFFIGMSSFQSFMLFRLNPDTGPYFTYYDSKGDGGDSLLLLLLLMFFFWGG